MDGPDIERIVAAVADVPDDLDKDELLSDLEGAVSLYRHAGQSGCQHRPERSPGHVSDSVA
jgi:hypothetical protein